MKHQMLLPFSGLVSYIHTRQPCMRTTQGDLPWNAAAGIPWQTPCSSQAVPRTWDVAEAQEFPLQARRCRLSWQRVSAVPRQLVLPGRLLRRRVLGCACGVQGFAMSARRLKPVPSVVCAAELVSSSSAFN